eukprot:67698_1
MSKLIFHRIIKLSTIPFTEESIYVATCIKNPFRCIDLLRNEHTRIKLTMQSFEKLLDKIQYQSHSTNTVSEQHIIDLNRFLHFCRTYHTYHHNKEEIMYEHTYHHINRKDPFSVNYITLNEIENDHTYGRNLYQLIEKTSNSVSDENEPTSIDDMIIPSKSFIHLLYDHMLKEENILYPKIMVELNQSEMEQISEKLESSDKENTDDINAMELLSDELIEKYT